MNDLLNQEKMPKGKKRSTSSQPLIFKNPFYTTGVTNDLPVIEAPLVSSGYNNANAFEEQWAMRRMSEMRSAGIDPRFFKAFIEGRTIYDAALNNPYIQPQPVVQPQHAQPQPQQQPQQRPMDNNNPYRY